MKLFSIITICLNAEDIIENTILSVLSQYCDNFEYIIQDGGSRDKTLKIAESFSSAFADKGIPFRIVSQKDSGIYDAMNKATDNAQGEWVLYLNAGDCFANSTVLSQVSKNANLENSDVIYGDVILEQGNLYMYKKAAPLETIRFGMPFCHQSVFVRKALLKASPFSLQYKILGDFLFFLQLYYSEKNFEYLPMAISIYDINGISSDKYARQTEKLKIYESMPIRDEEAIQKTKESLKEECNKKSKHELLRKFIPAKLRQIRHEHWLKKSGWKTQEEFFYTITHK